MDLIVYRYPVTYPKAQRGGRGIALLFLDLGARRVWVVSTTPPPPYPWERPGTHCTGGWVGFDSVVNTIAIARCTHDIKSRTVMVKAAFIKMTLFTSKLNLNLGKELVKCYSWSIALCSAET
jgi:hypothetical protein